MTARVWYSAEQPFLFPPLYIVERIARVHHWVVLEEAQFDRDHIQFALRAGHTWVKVSPELTKPGRRPFNQHRLLAPHAFARKLASMAQTSYGKQSGYRQLKEPFAALLARMAEQDDLVRLCRLSLEWIVRELRLDMNLHRSTDLVPLRPPDPTGWMASFAGGLGATDYLQGARSMQAYFERGPFEAAGVATWGQRFEFCYPTLGGAPADATSSVLDLLFMVGPLQAAEILGREKGEARGSMLPIVRGAA